MNRNVVIRYGIFHTYSMRIACCALLVLASGDCQTLQENIMNHVHSNVVSTEANNYSCLKLANPTRDAILMGDVQET
ncbi:MAG: uncharacterized protein KVP18_005085 [Porospora cf. gigantea A]|uniref:uncharacterized protein n=1 Tax=Porospora cf. gigantea A TaxID=2853593 RepID=UPI0035594A2A|nr:MAG: hypothetical protein KVP18_005085 [Porospora cf. gigantea A]